VLTGRIIGGEESEISKFPYQLSLRIGGRHNCGASVIANRYALTAAHCLDKQKVGEISLLGGSTTYGSGGKVFEAEAFFMHPDYNSRRSDYDVGLIKTKTDLIGENISKVDLPSPNGHITIGKNATVSGWGYMKDGEKILSEKLRYVEIPTIDQEICNQALADFGGVRGMMFCAGAPSKDACQGDSGGPIVMDSVQIGIVCGGLTCGSEEYYGVYSRLSNANIRAFIKNVAKV